MFALFNKEGLGLTIRAISLVLAAAACAYTALLLRRSCSLLLAALGAHLQAQEFLYIGI